MRALVRKVTEGIGKALTEGLAQPVKNLAKATAVGAEIIAIDQNAHDTVRRAPAAHVIPARINGPLKSDRDTWRNSGLARHRSYAPAG